jgi:mannose-6-phosphate isomerase class I
MFFPHPYDDDTPINRPKLPPETADGIRQGMDSVIKTLADVLLEKDKAGLTVCIEGYPSVDFPGFVSTLVTALEGKRVKLFDVGTFYKDSGQLENQFSPYLSQDRTEDPVLLFGKLYKGDYRSIFDEEKLQKAFLEIKRYKEEGALVIVYGLGSALEYLRPLYDYIIYIDITPKEVMLRAKAGNMINVGDRSPRPLRELQRRAYYVDFELAADLRRVLLQNNLVDYYITANTPHTTTLVKREIFNAIMETLAGYPFRCKPVYLEGVWGGHYVEKIRKLPPVFRNIAWVFDLIPREVSILIEAGEIILEIPFFTFVQKMGREILGNECYERFGGNFPIRFNYDDTFHSGGNMSVQVHPPAAYCREHFNEFGSQDEGYYVVATGHGAQTYCGLKKSADVKAFFAEIEKSETDKTPVDYQKYINALASVPGRQFLLPGGTIHASGRNQVVLEIGSLTIGSYTFKLYDYLRIDLNGEFRPIHSKQGKKVLDASRDEDFVNSRLVKPPVTIREGENWRETIAGEDELVYYSTRQLIFKEKITDDTRGKFHVLALVDGESVTVSAKEKPERSYTMSYLDIIVVPASIGRYVITNRKNSPVVVYKVLVK